MAMSSARRARFPLRAALLLLAALGSGAVQPPTAWPAPSDRKVLNLRGRVADPSGAPIADARVEVTGTIEATALTSPDGHFQLDLDLGSLEDLARRSTAVELRASLPGYRVVVAGGEPALAIEVRLRSERGTPVLEARSNYGLIANALLDALSPPGLRTASIQVAFRATRGAEDTARVLVPEKFSSVPVPEPWVNQVAPPAAPAPARSASRSPEVAKPPAPPTPPPAAKAKPAPPVKGETRTPPAAGKSASPPVRETAVARTDTKSAPVETPRPSRKKKRAPKKRRAENRVANEGPVLAPVPLPAPATTNLDSIWQRQERERQARIAAAQAVRDSIFAAQQEAGRAWRAMMDSIRAARSTEQDSIRRARLGLAPESPPAKPAERARDEQATRPPISPTVSRPSTPSGLQRVEPRADGVVETDADRAERARLEADSCTCRVRGTVELEFHRLLSSPLKVEVSIRELPALRDTVELFMGSPRAFEMRRVPCGRWSLAVRPFSDRPFGVTTPTEVAPFDCRQRGLRQVRIVLAPVRGSR